MPCIGRRLRYRETRYLAFLHVAPGSMRFNGNLGAWYAAAARTTAVAEVAHHLRREAIARGVSAIERTYRGYTCTFTGPL